ncbi:amidohydrolase [Paludibaculum fermentans]|uniref:amidohydrolase n=1 Tax=Paludibaculum fermentans TaxID=1473598 RepID=UPI003EB69CAB
MGAKTRIVDGKGSLVTPGLNDSHIHLMSYDRAHPFPPIFLRFLHGRQQVAEKIASYAAKLPKGSWILGEDWTDSVWAGPLPTRVWLDSLAPDHPVWLVGREGNSGIANSAALRAAKIDRQTADEPPGAIERDGKGDATGVIRGGPMWRIEATLIERSRDADDRAIEQVMTGLLRTGVTSVQHNNSWYDFLVLRRLHQEAKLRIRIYASPPLPAWERLRDYVGAQGRGDTWMHWGGLKGYGAIQADQYYRWVSGASKAGLQVMAHLGSESEMRQLLQVYGRVRGEQKLTDPRFRLEHGHDMPADLIPVLAQVGAVASMQPPLLAHFDQRTALGVPAPKNLFPCRAILEAGVRIAFGTDTYPATEIIAPAASLQMALERAAPDGTRLTIDEALRAYTLDAAYAEFAEREKGSLEPGKLADFVLFDRDFTRGSVHSIGNAEARMTVVGGRVMYDAL